MPSRSTTLPSASRGNSRKVPSSSPEASLVGPEPEPGKDAARVVDAGRAPARSGRREIPSALPRTAAADFREHALATTPGHAETRDADADASADMSRGLERRKRTRAFARVAVCRRLRLLPSARRARSPRARYIFYLYPTDRNSSVRPRISVRQSHGVDRRPRTFCSSEEEERNDGRGALPRRATQSPRTQPDAGPRHDLALRLSRVLVRRNDLARPSASSPTADH